MPSLKHRTLMKEGKEVLLVTSGAVGLAFRSLDWTKTQALAYETGLRCSRTGSADGSLFRSLQGLDIITAQIL